MTTTSIRITITEELRYFMDNLIKEGQYVSYSEIIREQLRAFQSKLEADARDALRAIAT